MNDGHRRIHLLVEGQTEEIVVNEVVMPHLAAHGWWATQSLVTTKRPAAGPAHKGGVTSWRNYYAFPADSPGMADRPTGTPYDRVEHVERVLCDAIGDRRFLPNLVLHELEAWVFAAADQLGSFRDEPELADRLKHDSLLAGGPELVNDHPETAPSKRLAHYCPTYTKTLDGPLAIGELGIEALRGQCPHFDQWLRKLAT